MMQRRLFYGVTKMIYVHVTSAHINVREENPSSARSLRPTYISLAGIRRLVTM